MPLLTKESWFGPRHLPGYGWSPRTWQGWLVIFVFIAAILACAFLLPGVALKVGAVVVLVALLVAVCLLTGTRPSSGTR
jgi:uncharacterized membrane protein YphA (DoxX/SURF4 family)